MKRILAIIFSVFIFGSNFAVASTPVDLYFFNGDGCPHCAKEEKFLEDLEGKQIVSVHRFEVWHNQANAELMGKVGQALKVTESGVPLTVVGSRYIVGFDEANTTGKDILQLIEQEKTSSNQNVVANLIGGNKTPLDNVGKPDKQEGYDRAIAKTVKIPFFGDRQVVNFSLPILTAVIGLLDSFNPCAMWVLLFLIGILLNMNVRKKMWLMGGVFLGSSALAYFVFLAAWLNIYQFMSYIRWINTAIAVIAIGAGLFSFWDFWVSRNGGCDIAGNPTKRKLIMEKIKNFAQNESFFVALFGLALVGAGVNMIELLCSAGLPAIYIPILTATAKSSLVYYLYLLVYCFFYILPQLIVFLIAMFTLRQVAVGSRVTRWFALASGVLMMTVGLLLLFKPNLLGIFK